MASQDPETKHQISLPEDIILTIVDNYHGDKEALLLVCKLFNQRYRWHVIHKRHMQGIRDTLFLSYIRRKYERGGKFEHFESFAITHPECEEHALVLHKWHNKKYPDKPGLFVKNINHLVGNTYALTEKVYNEYINKYNLRQRLPTL